MDEKAARVVRVFGWILAIPVGIGMLGVMGAFLFQFIKNPASLDGTYVIGLVVVAFLESLFIYFQFALSTGLKQHKAWARTWGIIDAVILLLCFPITMFLGGAPFLVWCLSIIGTFIGGYILWCLIKGRDISAIKGDRFTF
jgi:hypothetical protein